MSWSILLHLHSTNVKAVTGFGIDESNMFQFWDWVGGQFSLWSMIGVLIVLVIGYDNFEKLLKGAHDMDKHFKETPLENNSLVLMMSIDLGYNYFYGMHLYIHVPDILVDMKQLLRISLSFLTTSISINLLIISIKYIP